MTNTPNDPPDTENVSIFPSNQPMSADLLLQKAREWNLQKVLVIGWDENDEFVIGGSDPKLSEISWLLRHAEHWLSECIRNG